MTQFVDFVALGWVEENLREAVEAASTGLHRYQREPDEPQHLLDAQRSIHSATGVLRLCALEPAALLSDEIEQVLGLLREGAITGDSRKSAMTELVAGIEAIPAYLANVRAEREVTPGSIAAVVNDLRQFGNRPPLPDSLFFNPAISADTGVTPTDAIATEVSAIEFAKSATRVCHECSQGALKGDVEALHRLRTMGEEATVKLTGTPLEPYFRCYTALIEVISSGDLKPDEVILDILKHCFNTLKNLSLAGYPALEESKLDIYTKRILFYIGKQPAPSASHQALLDTFGIDDVDSYTACSEARMIQEDDLLDALEQTMQQLREVMAFLANSGQQISSANSELVEKIVPSLQQVSLQLHVVGLPELASTVNEQYKVLRGFAQQPQATPPSELLDFGGAMSAVRDQLEFKLQHGLAAEGDAAALDLDTALTEQVTRCLRDMKDHISHEFVRRDLDQLAATAPEALDISLGGLRPIFRAARFTGETDLLNAAEHWEDTRFPAADTLLLIASKLLARIHEDDFVGRARTDLDQVLTVLGMLENKQREHDVLSECARYLDSAVELGGLINDESMACFAESVAALEQYMESRIVDPQGNPEQHLLRAESLAQDLETHRTHRANRTSPDSNVLAFTSRSAQAADILEVDLADLIDPASTAVADKESAEAPELIPAAGPASGNTPWRDAMAAWASTRIKREPEPAPEGPDAEIDQELLECFTEEAVDYFNNLLELVEKLSIAPDDQATIKDIRVVFHTMKGSARTIGLDTFGEFMHDMEAVFNGLRDGYIQSSAETAEFTQYVASQLGRYNELIEARVPLYPTDFDTPHTIAQAITEKCFSEAFTVEVANAGAAVAETEEYTEDASEAVIVYSPEVWTQCTAGQILSSVVSRLDETAASASRTEQEQAKTLATTVLSALLELRDGGVLEPGTENIALFLGLPSIERLAEGAIYGLVETGEGEHRRISLSEESADCLQDYLDEIKRTDSLVLLHHSAATLLCKGLGFDETQLEEDEQPVSPRPDNVVPLRESDGHAASQLEDIDEELLELFIETLDEYIESIDHAVTGIGRQDESALRSLKNTLHTVKGAANSVGLPSLGTLVHDFESRILDIEHTGSVFSKDSVIAIDSIVHEFSQATQFVRRHKQDWDESAAATAKSAADELETLPLDTEQDGAAEAEAASEQKNDALRVETHRVDRLLDMGLEISMSNVRCRQSLDAAAQDRTEMQSLARRVLTLVDKLSLQLDTEIQAKTEAMPDGEQFDPLEMDRMTEKQGLAAILREAAYDLQEESRDLGQHMDNALREAQSSGRLLQTNQSELRQLRLVNFSKLGPGFRRLVHQVSRQLGKQVEFEFDCGKGGLDIRVFEQLRVALEHMLRNAVDHGIGTPEQRRAQGKAEHGNIKLSIARSGSEFTIRLIDDGRGIDPETLRERALALGLIQADEELSDTEALRLILRAGFSTAEEVTDVSGRGVGMDVVHQAITQVGGSVEIQSKPGFFTQIDIQVPASIMVNEALLATVGEEQIAVPLTSLKGSGFHRRDDVHGEAENPDGSLNFRGEDYEVRYLGTVRGTLPMPSLDAMPDFVPVLFAQLKRRRVAFFADALDTAEDMVIRALGSQYTGVPGIAGGAVKSDGQPVLALDLNEFIGQVDYADELAQGASASHDDSTLILCIDDSVMMRRTYEKRLESLGYKVVTAVDGEDALDYLSQATRAPDFIFTDLEMPNMNGFDFIANLRRMPELAHIPTVVVSSRDADKHRAEAQRVGASGFMAKGSNSAEGMQAVITQHLEAARTALVS